MGRTPYGITKGAVNLLTMQLGAEWAMYHIKVNAIAPGWIETEMVKRPLRSGILDEKKIPFRLADRAFRKGRGNRKSGAVPCRG